MALTPDQVRAESQRLVASGMLEWICSELSDDAFDKFKCARMCDQFLEAKAFLDVIDHLRSLIDSKVV